MLVVVARVVHFGVDGQTLTDKSEEQSAHACVHNTTCNVKPLEKLGQGVQHAA